jgi:hypothetical protein
MSVFQPPDPIAHARRVEGSAPNTAGLLSQVVAAESAGLPDQAIVQVAVSQIITNGAPAFAGTLTSAPALYSTQAPAFLRHFTLGVDALVVTPPSQDPASALPAGVIFSSVGLFIGSTTTRDVADAYVDAARGLEGDIDAYETLVASALQAAVSAHVSHGVSDDPGARTFATRYAAETALRTFETTLADYYERVYLEPWRARHRGEFDVALRMRVTPDATWVPVLPDLLSVGLTAGGYYDLTAADLPLRGLEAVAFEAAASVSASGFPTPSSGKGDAIYNREHVDGAGRAVGPRYSGSAQSPTHPTPSAGTVGSPRKVDTGMRSVPGGMERMERCPPSQCSRDASTTSSVPSTTMVGPSPSRFTQALWAHGIVETSTTVCTRCP